MHASDRRHYIVGLARLTNQALNQTEFVICRTYRLGGVENQTIHSMHFNYIPFLGIFFFVGSFFVDLLKRRCEIEWISYHYLSDFI